MGQSPPTRAANAPIDRGLLKAAVTRRRAVRATSTPTASESTQPRSPPARRSRPGCQGRAWTGLLPLRLHDLRHTCATLLLAEGIHPKIVQERLGHSDVGMTLNRYSHVTPGMQRQAADALDAALEAAAAS